VVQNNGVITRYLWDSQSMYGDVVLETDSVGTPQVNYVLGETQLLAQVRGSDISYFLSDVPGSTRLLTDVAGNITDTYPYDTRLSFTLLREESPVINTVGKCFR
jgi:hypothetical protein